MRGLRRPLGPRAALAAVTAFALLLMGVASISSASDSVRVVPQYAAGLAGGRSDDGSFWEVLAFGRPDLGQCWGVRVGGSGAPDESADCGFEVPERPLQLAVQGPVGAGGAPRSLLFFLARRNVTLIKVVGERPNGLRVPIRIHVSPIGRQQARGAHLRPSFGYGATVVSGRMQCIRRIVAFDRAHRMVAERPASGCGS